VNVDWVKRYCARHAAFRGSAAANGERLASGGGGGGGGLVDGLGWSEQPLPIAIEDCHEFGKCPHLWNALPRASDAPSGRILETRNCGACRKTVAFCGHEETVDLLVRTHLIPRSSAIGFDGGTACAYRLDRDPPPEVDWGFSEWYFGPISRDDAKAILSRARLGAFLVRESLTRPQEYAISVAAGQTVEHIRIIKDSAGVRIAQSLAFDTLPSLIAHYQSDTLANDFGLRTTLASVPSWRDVVAVRPKIGEACAGRRAYLNDEHARKTALEMAKL
jgi:hypothetical protein